MRFGTQKEFIFCKRWSVICKNRVRQGLFLTTKEDALPSPTPSKEFLFPYLFLGSASLSKLVFTFKQKPLQDQSVHQMGRRWIIASKARWRVWWVRNTKFGFQKKINTNEEENWEEGNGFLEDSVLFFAGKISIVLKDFTPAGYPSYHFAHWVAIQACGLGAPTGGLLAVQNQMAVWKLGRWFYFHSIKSNISWDEGCYAAWKRFF